MELFDILAVKLDKQAPGEITTEGAVWTAINSVSMNNAELGTYMYAMSISYSMADTNDSARFRYRVDGGAWYEFSKESKDVTNTEPMYYGFPISAASGNLSFEVEATKEDGGNTMTVHFADAWIQRVG